MIIQKKMNEKLLARQKNLYLNNKNDAVQNNDKKKNPQSNTSVPAKDGSTVAPKKP
jgi:hypothetical protein